MPKYAVMNKKGEALIEEHPGYSFLLLDKGVFVRIKGDDFAPTIFGDARRTYEFDSEIYASVEIYEDAVDVYELSEDGPTDEERKLFDMLYPGWCMESDLLLEGK